MKSLILVFICLVMLQDVFTLLSINNTQILQKDDIYNLENLKEISRLIVKSIR